MDFKAMPRTISDTFGLKRKYIIPRFQREYSWENDELLELWDDLMDNLGFDNDTLIASEYFIGALVLIGDDDDSTNIERQVVDGQQRLMTITIAFSVLSQIFEQLGEDKLSSVVHHYIIGEDENGNEYTKLVSESPKPFFQYRIQQKNVDLTQVPRTSEEKRILAAYKFFEKKLGENSLIKELNEKYPQKPITYLDALKLFRDQLLKCKVIYVTVKNFDDAYTIFEVLNAKGKNLSPTDLIKNSLFSQVSSTVPLDSAQEKWTNIKNNIDSGKGDDLLTFYRHYWLSKYSFTTKKKLVSEFNKNIGKNIDEYESFLDELEKASKYYSLISQPEESDWTQPEEKIIYETLDALNIFSVTQVRIFILSLLDARERKVLKHKALIDCLEFLQYYHLVFNAVCHSRPSGLERRYSSYARKLRQCMDKEQCYDCIHKLKEALNTSFPTYTEFENAFVNLSYTSSNPKDKKIVQYILRRIEKIYSNTDEMRPSSITIEHIMPESSKLDCVGKIGNLLPLGERLNSDLGDKDFSLKVTKYKNSEYKTVQSFVSEFGNETVWSEELIMKRTKELAHLIFNKKKTNN